MKTENMSRRTLVAGGLALAAPATAALPAAIGAELDPIFAAIERHKAAEDAYSVVSKDDDRLSGLIPEDSRKGWLWFPDEQPLHLDPKDDPRWTAHLTALYRVACELHEPKAELLDTVPTTMAGVIALIRHARERDACGDGCLAVDLYGNIADALEDIAEAAA
jgi:hypothetical protein